MPNHVVDEACVLSGPVKDEYEGDNDGSNRWSSPPQNDDDDDYDDMFCSKRQRRLEGPRGSSTQRLLARELPTVIQHSAFNSIVAGEMKAAEPRNRGLTRDTRATVDLVLDNRTVLMLAKLQKWNVFTELFGCISTGKEANVYLALRKSDGEPDTFLAVKVYKTSILVFKDRSRYVQGEFRFRRGYAGSSNPRKMVRQWAEKEYRNLLRIASCGLRGPRPIELRGHVLAMAFLGTAEGLAAPKLKDLAKARFPQSFWRRIYVETIALMRSLFQECKLTHADCSEYNLLFCRGHPYLIDVSQSVESDHPHSFDFLKRDCLNVMRFFAPLVAGEQAGEQEEAGGEREEQAGEQEEAGGEREEAGDEPYEEGCSKWTAEFAAYVSESAEMCDGKLTWEWSLYPVKALFAYVTEPNFVLVDESRHAEWVDHDEAEVKSRRRFNALCVATMEALIEEPVEVSEEEQQMFLQTWTASNLHHITDFGALEKEIEKQKLLAMGKENKNDEDDEDVEDDEDGEDVEDVEDENDEYDEDESIEERQIAAVGHVVCKAVDNERIEVQLIRGRIPKGFDPKEWKRIVKEQNRERRTKKLKKHIKKKKCKTPGTKKKR